MIDLDDAAGLRALDRGRMLELVADLPRQLRAGWAQAMGASLPRGWEASAFDAIVIAGMGGSAIGASLAAALTAGECAIPVVVVRDYVLPAFARGPRTLVIGSSYSGETEETLEAFETAWKRGCALAAMATGGRLAAQALEWEVPFFPIEGVGQPRAALGYSFSMLLGLLHRLGLIPDAGRAIEEAASQLEAEAARMALEVPVAQNPAKRMAGQLIGRIPVIFGSGPLAEVARRWKSQINENAKAVAVFEALPEGDHNTIVGTECPGEVLRHLIAVFLTAPLDHPRNALRVRITRELFMRRGVSTDLVVGRGGSGIAQAFSLILLGDFISVYLALAYQIDPTPVQVITELKARLAAGE
ncbi:MAG: bifunctional phosphoglucose/phosphomannose isomerase [Anaerolineae bacterium]|nr:bifunctional phosphoglucose/phosphomannose isomerase [Anaerolineae bacterium]